MQSYRLTATCSCYCGAD